MRRGPWVALVAVFAWAATQAGVTDVVSVVRSSIGNNQADARTAKVLHRMKLTERLDQHTVEELESEGAGPKVLAELERLRQLSGILPPPRTPPSFAPRPAPTPGDQKRIVESSRQSALNYIHSLPDFICTEVVRRYDNTRGKLIDTLTLKLSYFGQKENYQLLTINGHPTFLKYDAVGGVITQGEFGSLLSEVFEPKSATEFQWDHWTTLRKRPAQVYAFSVDAGKSHYRIEAVGRTERLTAAVGQHGFVYVDRETGQTVRVIAEADHIPPDFPVSSATTTLDYDFADIGGRQFLLPLHADVRMKTQDAETRNDVEFHAYKKFSSDATITFDPH